MHYTEVLLLATISIVKFCSYPLNFVTSFFAAASCSRAEAEKLLNVI